MKKRQLKKLTAIMSGMIALNILVGTSFVVNAESVNVDDRVKIEQSEDDIRVIPDKYNTGAKGEFTIVEMGQKVGDIQFAAGSNSTVNVIDFEYRNKDISGTITFENMDFSKYPVAIYNDKQLSKNIKIIFNNCKFGKITKGKEKNGISCEFNHCSIVQFSGGNAKFDYCQFGNSYLDGVVPFQNISVSNSYFMNQIDEKSEGNGYHTDGTHIYGVNGLDVIDVSYDNCRFELPAVPKEGAASVNACLMLQMEYSDADGVSFKDCVVNGGGYTIYAHGTGAYTLNNAVFDDIKVGCARKFGVIYPDVSKEVTLENISLTDSLYIGSVWKSDGATHFSVSNDTNQARKLTICTDKGNFEYSIPACPAGNQLTSEMNFSDFPFDMDIIVPQDCAYAVCFDTTLEGAPKQVRYVNWKNTDVFFEGEEVDKFLLQQEQVILAGKCGNEVDFVLTNDQILTLSGKGATYNYHSGKQAPWSEYRDFIKVIKVNPGIDKLGNQLFTGCAGVQYVFLPEGLTAISSRAFERCSSLLDIKLPGSLQEIGGSAFNGVFAQTVKYSGNDKILVEDGNEWISYRLRYNNEVSATPAPEVVATPAPEVVATPAPEVVATPVPAVTATPAPKATATPTPEVLITPTPEATITPTPNDEEEETPKKNIGETLSPSPMVPESELTEDQEMVYEENDEKIIAISDSTEDTMKQEHMADSSVYEVVNLEGQLNDTETVGTKYVTDSKESESKTPVGAVATVAVTGAAGAGAYVIKRKK